MVVHKQKPCALIGTSLCGNFKKGDIITVVKDNINCKECKKRCKK